MILTTSARILAHPLEPRVVFSIIGTWIQQPGAAIPDLDRTMWRRWSDSSLPDAHMAAMSRMPYLRRSQLKTAPRSRSPIVISAGFPACVGSIRWKRERYSCSSSCVVKKYFSSCSAVSGASEPWMALRSMLSA